MKMKRITSIICIMAMLLGVMPALTVGAENVVYADLHTFNGNTKFDECLSKAGGNGRSSTSLNGESCYWIESDGNKQSGFKFKTLKVGDILTAEDYSEQLVFSVDVYFNSDLNNIFLRWSSDTDILGMKAIERKNFNENQWNTLTFVYVPSSTETSVYLFINQEFYSVTNKNSTPFDSEDIRILANTNETGKNVYYDNIRLIKVSGFKDVRWENAGYLQNGEIVNYYGKKCSEFLTEVSRDNAKIVNADGTATVGTDWLKKGMKLELSNEIKVDNTLYYTLKKSIPFGAVQTHVDVAKANLSAPPSETTSNLDLPTEYLVDGSSDKRVAISWESNLPTVLSNSGAIVSQPEYSTKITLKATFTDKTGYSDTKEYPVWVTGSVESSINFCDVKLSSYNAYVGETINFSMERYANGVTPIESCEAECISENKDYLTIDNTAKTLTAAVPGAYTVKFVDKYSDNTKTAVVSFDTKDYYEVIEKETVVLEDSVYDSSQDSSLIYGTDLTDYVVEADVKVINQGTNQSNFTIRMRADSEKNGYNFSFIPGIRFENGDINTNKVSGKEAVGYDFVNNLFAITKGADKVAETWKYVKVVEDESNIVATNKSFNDTYRMKASVIDGKMIGEVLDKTTGEQLIKVEAPLADMGTVTAAGKTYLVKHSTKNTVENIQIHKNLKWIKGVQLETNPTSDLVLSLENGPIQLNCKVTGIDSSADGIDMTNHSATELKCINSKGEQVSIVEGVLTISEQDTYYLTADVNGHSVTKEIKALANAEAINNAYDSLVIENLDNVKNSFDLPKLSGYSIDWNSSDEAIKIEGNTAKVTRPGTESADEFKEVKLTATVFCEGFVKDKEFVLKVIKEKTHEQAVNDAIKMVTLPTTVSNGDTIALPSTADEEEHVSVAWTSRSPSVISNAGAVTAPQTTTTVNIVGTYSRSGFSKDVVYAISVTGTGTGGGGGTGDGGAGGSGGGGIGGGNDDTHDMSGAVGLVPPNVDYVPTDTNPSQGVSKFSDVPQNAWYKEYVEQLSDKGIMNGVGDGKFEPERSITREEVVAVICRSFGIEEADGGGFGDVSPDAWYSGYINAAKENGIISGITEEMFGIGTNITRQDLCVMVGRILGYTDAKPTYNESFADDAELSDYARDFVYLLKELGIINGKDEGKFAPQDTATRAEIAAIIIRALEVKAGR